MILTRLSVRRKLATGAITFALTVLGLYGLWQLPVNFLPDVTYPLIKVQIWYPGATPEEIETAVAEPVESQMATVDNLDYLESSSIEGMYVLQANFKYGANIDVAYQDALAAMARVARSLPKDIDAPVVIKADPSSLPVMQLTVESGKWDLVRLRSWVENSYQTDLLSVNGVAGVEISGGMKREIRVLVDRQALEKYGLSNGDLVKRLREDNLEQFGGRITAGSKEIIARTTGEFQNLEDIRNIKILRNGLSSVTLRDVAKVVDGYETQRLVTRMDGKPCVKLSVLKQASANTVDVAKAVDQKVKALQSQLPPGVVLKVVENQADYVQSSLNGVRNAALEAALLVILIVWIFLGSWRQVLIISITLPLTLVLNFALMKLAGFSLNIFSLGGLVVAMGILVDNSILVVEAITRRKHDGHDDNVDDLVENATSEIGTAMVAATLSFLALFLPFLLVPGLISLLFKELILVIAGIVVVSLVMALTVTPMISSLILGKDLQGHKTSAFERFFEHWTERYGSLLAIALRHKWMVVASFASALIIAGFHSRSLGSEFLPQMDDGRIVVKVKMPTGTSVAKTDTVLKKLEKAVKDDSRIESIFTLGGGKVWGLYTFEIANEGELDIQLKPAHERKITTKAFMDVLRPLVAKVGVPGGNIMVMQMKTKGLRSLGEADIEVKIRGQNLETLFQLAGKTTKLMNEQEHFRNVYVSLDMNKPEYRIEVDRQRADAFGISTAEIADATKALVSGSVPGQYHDRAQDDYFNIRVVLPDSTMDSRQAVEDLPLKLGAGGMIRLRDVAQVVKANGPVEIIREDQIKEVVVRGDASGASIGAALSELQNALKATDLPSGYEIRFGGSAKMISDMKQSMLVILLFAIFFAFVILTVQFNSAKLPALILGSVPFSMIGLVVAMTLTNTVIGATVVIGILIVVASTINDGVLLMVYANDLRTTKGLSPFDAVLTASKIRLRPRVMVTVSVLVGFIPLALALEDGGDMLQPMAIAAIGGLAMALPVALVFMPCIYLIFPGKLVQHPSALPESSERSLSC